MHRLLPTRDALQDAGLLLTLAAIATIGFRDTFDGFSFLLAAAAGWLLGVTLAHVANSLAKPVLLLAVLTVGTFFLLGGAVSLHGEGPTALLPLPDTLTRLADGGVHGWKDLLTTLAPVEGGPLLVLPYVMGLIGGAGGMALAGRTRSALLPLLAPLSYLAAIILLGVQAPTRAAVLGGAFATVSTAWVAVRSKRYRSAAFATGTRWRRKAAAVALVATAGLLGSALGPHLPFMGDRERLVLRTYVTPPFDVGEYSSPLAGFRKYTKDYRAKRPADKLYDVALMTVNGLPEGSLLRFASLDEYDGFVWRAANQAPGTTGAAGAFQRVGSVIRSGATGQTHDVSVELGPGYQSAWLPTAGSLTEIHFAGRDGQDRAASFRYNLSTSTGVVPAGIAEGDRYSFRAKVDARSVSDTMVPSTAALTVDTGVDFAPVVRRWGGAGSTPMQQVLAIARFLRENGKYTDGEAGFEQYLAGHSARRLSTFSAEGAQIAGNDEQYAAMLALLANQVGVPSRAVIGAKVPEGGLVKGKDVRAWVEIKDQSGSWHVLATEEFMSREREPEQENPKPQELSAGKVIPPPAPVRPPSVAGDPLSDAVNQKGKQSKGLLSFSVPGWVTALGRYIGLPLLLIALVLATIVVLKSRRRQRRRTRGTPATRLAAAWHDLVDHARDLGHSVHAQRTRRELADDLGLGPVHGLARRVDAYVFGAADPTDADADTCWQQVDEARRQIESGLSRRKRLLAAVSLTSFRAPARAGADA